MTFLKYVVIVLFAVGSSVAQPGWLKDIIANTALPSVAKEASALILYSTSEVEISHNSSKEHVRKVIKVLNASDDDIAIVREGISPSRKVDDLKGWVISPDQTTRELSKKNIVEYSPEASAPFYDDDRILIAKFPDVKLNDIVAFEYTIEEEDWSAAYKGFMFQTQEPVLFAQFSVEISDDWQLQHADWHMDSVSFERKENKYIWTARNLPFQPEEPLMPSWRWVQRRITINCFKPGESFRDQHFNDWAAVCRWSAEMYLKAIQPDTMIKQQALKITAGLQSHEEKFKAIASFARDQIRYVAVEIGVERWKPRPAGRTLFNKYGDCKDKVALLQAMLAAVDIPSVPVLANGRVPVQPEVTTPFQFNHVILAVPAGEFSDSVLLKHASDGKWFYFDPTDPELDPGQLPVQLQGNQALVVGERESTLVRLPRNDPENYYRKYEGDITISPEGAVQGKITIVDCRDMASEARFYFRTYPKDKMIEGWQRHLSKTLPSPTITHHDIKIFNDSTIETVQFEASNVLVHAGKDDYLKPDIYRPYDIPVLSKEKRTHPVSFGRNYRIEFDVQWHLPQSWKVGLPAGPVSSACDVARAEGSVTLSDHVLKFHSREDYRYKFLPLTRYEEAKKFTRELNELRNTALLITK
jgi:transglutaminase-like putative cysteine protease